MAQAPESGAAPGSSSSDSFVIVGGGGGGGNHQSAELGVEVMWQRSGLLVCELLPNHPAELSGMIHEGDVIKAVKCAQRGWTAWQTTAEMSVDEGADMLRGAVGDLLRLRIAREEAVFDCTIELTKPWVPVDPSRIKRRPDPPAKRVTARDIEESIASASAKVHASSRGAVQDKADEMEMQIMRRRRWAEGQAQNEPYTSRSGRAVVVCKNDEAAGVWRASLWVFLAMIWGWMLGKRYRAVADVEVGGEGGGMRDSDDSDFSDEDFDVSKVERHLP